MGEVMKKRFLLIVFSFCFSAIAIAQIADPNLLAVLNEYYLQKGELEIDASDIADRSITEIKLFSPLGLPANQITNTALTQVTVLSGPNISGVWNNLIITGFYSSSNPSNFTDLATVITYINGLNHITGPQVPTFETDPTVAGLNVTNVFTDAGAVVWTQVFLRGILELQTTNGSPHP